MRAVVSVIGKDRVGILAKVSTACASCNASVIEVSQTVMQDMFAMVMLVDIANLNVDFDGFVSAVEAIGSELSLSAHVMHEDIFNSMHKI